MLIDKGTHYEMENYNPPPGIYCPRIPKFIVERYKMKEILKQVIYDNQFREINEETISEMVTQISEKSGIDKELISLHILGSYDIQLSYRKQPGDNITLLHAHTKTEPIDISEYHRIPYEVICNESNNSGI